MRGWDVAKMRGAEVQECNTRKGNPYTLTFSSLTPLPALSGSILPSSFVR